MTKFKERWNLLKTFNNNLVERIAQKLVELNMMAALPGGGPFDSGNPGKNFGNAATTGTNGGLVIAAIGILGGIISILYLVNRGANHAARQLTPEEQREGVDDEIRKQQILEEEKTINDFERHEAAKKFKKDEDDDAWMNKGNDANSGGVD